MRGGPSRADWGLGHHSHKWIKASYGSGGAPIKGRFGPTLSLHPELPFHLLPWNDPARCQSCVLGLTQPLDHESDKL
jgi:hypothetical protein